MAWIEVPLRPRRRRAVIFLAAFIIACAASLTYTFIRPAEYRAVARLQISPASFAAADAKDAPGEGSGASRFLTEVQVLTSRPLLGEVVERLRADRPLPDLGADPVGAVQRMLSAEPVADTHVVQLIAQGTQRDFLPRVVNTVTEAYRQHVANSYKDSSANATTELADEARALEQDMAAKRQTVEAYRARYDIVSMERNENQILAKLNGLNNAYNDANAKLVAADARYEAVRRSAASGQGAASAKDDPTLADLEQRTSKLREQLQELLRRYTPDYLAMDPDWRSLSGRLDDLEKQLAARRVASQQAAIATAQQDAVSARSAVEQLRSERSERNDNQKEAQEFATHLNEYKAMQEDLAHVEALHRDALDRIAKLRATSLERAPQVEILEAAAPIEAPWRPDYRTDAVISVAGSFVFGLVAVLFGEFIAGPANSSGMTVRHSWVPSALGREMPLPLGYEKQMLPLPAPDPLPRELAEAELAALLTAANDDVRLVCVALLMGLSAEELVALCPEQIDLDRGLIRVSGASARAFALEEPLRGLIAERLRAQPKSAASLLHDAQGAPIGRDDLARMVLYAAYDSALERPHEITPAVLRYTYLAFLLRQGMRLSDIGRIAGHIPQAELVAFTQFATSEVRRPLEQIERILPPLRRLCDSGDTSGVDRA